ncbi:glycosyl transferase family 2 [candidate division BRC1 bacterium HGW-BRC1-1]|jgi:glycosyltransferase involved in cell wall biosynthesis|nr:MAG: glycosyl transferase family 2 [candidate division BRC1 bacterium HGW-BRC1-1]
MYKNKTIAVVIPSYRVADHIGEVVASVPDWVDHIIAVNDASPDTTAEVLARMAQSNPRLQVAHNAVNQGVGGAMATGFACALKMRADIVVKLDGDGQMDPERMIDLVDPIAVGVCDYAKGNRFLHAGALRDMPNARLMGNIALTFLTKAASGYWHVFDPQNGYLAISAPYLSLLDLEHLRTRRYFFENEMLIRLNIESARVLDCPMPAIYRGEISSLQIGKVLSYFPSLLVKGFFARLFQRHILRDFSIIVPLYLLGFLMTMFGTFFGGYVWIRGYMTGVLNPTGTVMLAVLPFILGIQFLLQGLTMEMLLSPRVQSPPRDNNGPPLG